MIGIGLIGTGRIGKLHARNIAANKDARLAVVYDPDVASADDLARRYNARVANDADEVIADKDVEAVYICSPTDTHVDLIRKASAAGKAIFCEKPVDLDMRVAMSVVEILTKSPVPLMMGFHRRFDPSTRRLAEHIATGRLGDIETMRVIARDVSLPPISYIKRSGGIFRDMMIHDLDLCRWLTGKEFTGVFAKGFCRIDPAVSAAGDFDTAFATLWTDDGTSVVLQSSRRSAHGFDQRIEVMGSNAAMRLDNVHLTQTALVSVDGVHSDTIPGTFSERYASAYVAQCQEFISALVDGRSLSPTIVDGLASLQLADGLALSAQTGKPVALQPLKASIVM